MHPKTKFHSAQIHKIIYCQVDVLTLCNSIIVPSPFYYYALHSLGFALHYVAHGGH